MCSFDDVKNFHWKSPISTTDSATPKVSSTKEFMDKWRGFMTARKVKYFYKGTNSNKWKSNSYALAQNPIALLIRPLQDVDVLAVLDFQIPCFRLRFLLCISEACPPTTKTMDENKDVHSTWGTGIRASKDPGRRGHRHPGEPCFWLDASKFVESISRFHDFYCAVSLQFAWTDF